MRLNEVLKKMLYSFFVITTGIVAAQYLFCLIFYPNSQFSIVTFGVILLSALVCDLPLLVFYSPKELNKQQMTRRMIIHFVLLLTILLGLSQLWNWVEINNIAEVAVFIFLVVCVYFIVQLITIYFEKRLADQLNQKLKERYPSE